MSFTLASLNKGNSSSLLKLFAEQRANLLFLVFYSDLILAIFLSCNDCRPSQKSNLWFGYVGQCGREERLSKTRFIVKCARNGAFTVQYTCLLRGD